MNAQATHEPSTAPSFPDLREALGRLRATLARVEEALRG